MRPRHKVSWYWACEFMDAEGNSEWKILAASTTLGAKKRAFEVGRLLNLSPNYETIREATASEIREMKKKIKDKIAKNKEQA